MKDFIIYHANRRYGNTEYYEGKEICINTDGNNQLSSVSAISSRSTYSNVGASSVSLYSTSTPPTSVRGMFRSYTSNQNVGIDNRELIWLRLGDNNLFFTSSTASVYTTSNSYQNDFTISTTFTEPHFVICMYNCSNVKGGTFGNTYVKLRTYISTLDIQRDPDGITCYNSLSNSATWGMGLRVCNIPAGDTTFISQFCSMDSGVYVTLGRRQFAIIAIPQSKIDDGTVERYFIEYNTNSVYTSSTAFVNDTYASLTFTPYTTRKALIIYNIMGYAASTSIEIAINVDGTDYNVSRATQHSLGSLSYYNATSILYLDSLSASQHTVKGRFMSSTGANVYITTRQMVALLW